MRADQHILLFAHPRSGSSSLYQILQRHPQLDIVEEPFNEHFTQWGANNPDYLSQVHDSASLDAVLENIFTTYNGLKVLDYQLPDDLIHHLLLRPDFAVIFLRRRNLLQAVVSVLIAEQTQLWKKWEMQQPFEEYYRNLQPLDIEDVRDSIITLQNHLDRCEGIVDTRTDRQVLKFVYEDLYYAPAEQRSEQIAAIWALLDLAPPDPASYQQFLRPEDAKINGAATYALLPNAEEINRACGNDRTGWLLSVNSV